jgi:hypothetical protein
VEEKRGVEKRTARLPSLSRFLTADLSGSGDD